MKIRTLFFYFVIISHSLSLLCSDQNFFITEQRVQNALCSLPQDHKFLLEYAHHTENRIAHRAVCDYLKQAPATDLNNWYINWYFRLLGPKERTDYFIPFLKRSIALTDEEDNQGFSTFYALTALALEDERTGVLEKIAATICKVEHIADVAYKLMAPEMPVCQAFLNAKPSTDEVATVQSLIYMQDKNHFTSFALLLESRPKVVELFVKSLEKIMMGSGLQKTVIRSKIPETAYREYKIVAKPYWQSVMSSFLRALLYDERFEESRLSFCKNISTVCAQNTKSVNRFCSSASSEWLTFLLLYADLTHYACNRQSTNVHSLSKYNELLERVCAINSNKLPARKRIYREFAAKTIYAALYTKSSPSQNCKLLDRMFTADFTFPHDELVRGLQSESGTARANWIELCTKYQEKISGIACFDISKIFGNAKDTQREDQWMKLAAQKGYEHAVGEFFLKAYLRGELVKGSSIISDGCVANPVSWYNKALRDLSYLYAIGNHASSLLSDINVEDFWREFLAANAVDPNNIKDGKCFLYAAYNWAFAAIMHHQLHGHTIDGSYVLLLLKKAYEQYRYHNDAVINPIKIMTAPIFTYCESIINKCCVENSGSSVSKEDAATATLMLVESRRLGHYKNDSIIEQGLKYALGSHNIFLHNDISFDFASLFFLLLSHQASIEQFIKNATWLYDLPLKKVQTIENMLGIQLRETPIYDILMKFGKSKEAELHRALRCLVRFNCFQDADEKKMVLALLCEYYKGSDEGKYLDKKKYDEVRQLLQEHIRETLLKSQLANANTKLKTLNQENSAGAENSIKMVYKRLYDNILIAEDMQIIKDALKADPTKSLYYVMQAGHDALSKNCMMITIALEQARQTAAQERHNKNWIEHITPATKELVWEIITKQSNDSSITQGMLTDRAYAACLHATTKTLVERMALLEPGRSKNAFCSLCYVRCLLDKEAQLPFQIDNWQKRRDIYDLLRYAIMQGQPSSIAAQDLDYASNIEATRLLQDWSNEADLGATITRASVSTNIAQNIEMIVSTPFAMQGSPSVIKPDIAIDDLIVYARECNLIEPITKKAHAQDAYAQGALFRILFSKIYSLLTTEKNFEEYRISVETILLYGLAYLNLKVAGDKKYVYDTVASGIDKLVSIHGSKNVALLKWHKGHIKH